MGRLSRCYEPFGVIAFLAIATAGCGSAKNPPLPTHAVSPNPNGQAGSNPAAATPHYSYEEISEPFPSDLNSANQTFAGREIEVSGNVDTGFAESGNVDFQSLDKKSELSKKSMHRNLPVRR